MTSTTFGQPLAKFLGAVLVALHDGDCCQNSQFVLQHVEERNRFVNMIHEQHVVLVGDLHKMVDNTACRSNDGPVAVLYPAGVDFCASDAACLGFA